MGNVGLFYALKKPPLVPDYLLSVGVEFPTDIWPKQNRSYFVWNYGKPPDLVLEIVSSTDGGEADTKRRLYAEIGVPYYVIHDPLNLLGAGVVVAFEVRGGEYHSMSPDLLPRLGLGLKLWTGRYWGMDAEWLRWCDESGTQLAARLAAKLQSLGIDPNL